MPNVELPILVVDDAKISSAVVGRMLKGGGYRDIRFASNARDALVQLEDRPAAVLLADWLMPEMDGLELVERVRQLDEQTNHFTYTILLTANEGYDVISRAFDRGVDDFINKSQMSEQLLPRVYAADRLSNMHNNLLEANQVLADNNHALSVHSIIDNLTGLPNKRHGMEHLGDCLRQCESRGGGISLLSIGIKNYKSICQQYDQNVQDELLVSFARRLRQLVRPLDKVFFINEEQYAIVTTHDKTDNLHPNCFRRIYEGLNLKSFKTAGGFIFVKSAVGVSTIVHSDPLPTADEYMRAANQLMQLSVEADALMVRRFKDHSGQATNTKL